MLKVAACGQKMQKEQVGTRRIKQESERGVLVCTTIFDQLRSATTSVVTLRAVA